MIMPELIYPCLAYAFKRAGYRTKWLTPHWVETELPQYISRYTLDSIVQPKAILMCESHRDDHTYAPVEIITQNKIPLIICRPIVYNFHAGVYEGSGIVSDMVLPDDNCLPFVVRNRLLTDISIPDGILDLPEKFK